MRNDSHFPLLIKTDVPNVPAHMQQNLVIRKVENLPSGTPFFVQATRFTGFDRILQVAKHCGNSQQNKMALARYAVLLTLDECMKQCTEHKRSKAAKELGQVFESMREVVDQIIKEEN